MNSFFFFFFFFFFFNKNFLIYLFNNNNNNNNNKDIRNWIRNIEQHASEGVNKILIGNKCDILEKKVHD